MDTRHHVLGAYDTTDGTAQTQLIPCSIVHHGHPLLMPADVGIGGPLSFFVSLPFC